MQVLWWLLLDAYARDMGSGEAAEWRFTKVDLGNLRSSLSNLQLAFTLRVKNQRAAKWDGELY
jgi:hypothetical protein